MSNRQTRETVDLDTLAIANVIPPTGQPDRWRLFAAAALQAYLSAGMAPAEACRAAATCGDVMIALEVLRFQK